jgi:hypothetical protein
MKMFRTKQALLMIGAALAGIITYYVLMGLLVYLLTDVLSISVSPADGSLVVLIIIKIVPLICAMVVFALIARAAWLKRSNSNDVK